MQTITGHFSPSVPGDQILRYRQSSLIGRCSTALSAPIAPTMLVPISATWGAMEPNVVASRTPVHGSGGCGARKRSFPVGGWAKGMPFQTLIEPCSLPWTFPYRVSMIGLFIFLLLQLFLFLWCCNNYSKSRTTFIARLGADDHINIDRRRPVVFFDLPESRESQKSGSVSLRGKVGEKDVRGRPPRPPRG